MANTAWRNVKARCPFFIRSNNRTITCQGAGKALESRQRYRNEASCGDVFGRFCATNYAKCPMYRLHEMALEEQTRAEGGETDSSLRSE